MLAQYPQHAAEAVEAAVYLHGLAADFAARTQDEHTVLATDTVAHLSDAFRFRVKDEEGIDVAMWTAGMKWVTNSAEETMQVGRELAAMLKPSQLLILRGDLGAGKTTLVKGIAAGLGAAEESDVTSPTFTLVHEYSGGGTTLYHLDLYRLENPRELDSLGIDEMQRADALVLIEWGEKFPTLVARADGEIALEHAGGDMRTIRLDRFGAGST